MAKADRLKTTFQKTAKKLEENVAKSVKRASRRSPGVPAHKHCKVCRISIHANSDPPSVERRLAKPNMNGSEATEATTDLDDRVHRRVHPSAWTQCVPSTHCMTAVTPHVVAMPVAMPYGPWSDIQPPTRSSGLAGIRVRRERPSRSGSSPLDCEGALVQDLLDSLDPCLLRCDRARLSLHRWHQVSLGPDLDEGCI